MAPDEETVDTAPEDVAGDEEIVAVLLEKGADEVEMTEAGSEVSAGASTVTVPVTIEQTEEDAADPLSTTAAGVVCAAWEDSVATSFPAPAIEVEVTSAEETETEDGAIV